MKRQTIIILKPPNQNEKVSQLSLAVTNTTILNEL